MGVVIINGQKITGKNISVVGNKVIVDGQDITPDSKTINISVQGNVTELKVDVCDKIEITGDVYSVKTQSGDVYVTGHVTGHIQTMSGDVKCGDVKGNISTMSGDIIQKTK